MQRLRRYRWLALALALWMSATVAAAVLAPHFKKGDAGNFAVLCTSVGMKLVSLDGDATGTASTGMGHSTLDCPGCLAQLSSAPPPSIANLALDSAQYFSTLLPAQHFYSREALTASARGPPLLSA